MPQPQKRKMTDFFSASSTSSIAPKSNDNSNPIPIEENSIEIEHVIIVDEAKKPKLAEPETPKSVSTFKLYPWIIRAFDGYWCQYCMRQYAAGKIQLSGQGDGKWVTKPLKKKYSRRLKEKATVHFNSDMHKTSAVVCFFFLGNHMNFNSYLDRSCPFHRSRVSSAAEDE